VAPELRDSQSILAASQSQAWPDRNVWPRQPPTRADGVEGCRVVSVSGAGNAGDMSKVTVWCPGAGLERVGRCYPAAVLSGAQPSLASHAKMNSPVTIVHSHPTIPARLSGASYRLLHTLRTTVLRLSFKVTLQFQPDSKQSLPPKPQSMSRQVSASIRQTSRIVLPACRPCHAHSAALELSAS
jgi:hypothetical protein